MPNRRLAAIMFADIAGYTAMMQEDETLGMAKARRFREVMEELMEPHQGELLEMRGDGSLSIFASAVEAVNCARKIQKALRDEVPLRIGIHLGDIVHDQGHIFGDGVNVAARTESMGVPGAVLVTERVMQDLKNHPEHIMQSLGLFRFKNVSDPIEVFALANEGFVVPTPEEMKGKGEKLQTRRFTTRFLVRAASLGFLSMVLGASIFWMISSRQALDLLPESLREARIAVVPFQNQTADPELDVLGTMAADWITRSLLNQKDLKIIQFDLVKDHLNLLEESLSEAADQIGADRIIRGRYYLEGEELILESSIVNPYTAEVEVSFPIIRQPRDKPSLLVDELSQRVSGHFASRENKLIQLSQAPLYEAFVAYEQGLQVFGDDYVQARHHFLEAMSRDSNFLSPFILYAGSFMNEGKWEQADSLFQVIRKRFNQLTQVERYHLESAYAILEGDIEKEYRIMQDWLALDPKRFAVNYQFAETALGANRPQAAIEACEHLDPEEIEFDAPVKHWWFWVYARALARVGEWEEAREILQMVPRSVEPFYLLRQRIFTFQQQRDSLDALIKSMELQGAGEETIWQLMNSIVRDCAIQQDAEGLLYWVERTMRRIQASPESGVARDHALAQGYYGVGNMQEAAQRYRLLRRTEGDTWLILYRLACCEARLGNLDQTEALYQKLGELEGPYAQGFFKYHQALILAAAGEQEKALVRMKQAYKEGCSFNHWRYNYAYESIYLKGFPPYEEFVKPR